MDVRLEAIELNHDPTGASIDGLTIRRNAAQPVVVPENTNGAPGVNTYFDLMSAWVDGLAAAFKGSAS